MEKISKAYNYFYYFLRLFIKKSFPIWQRMGFHVTLNHFYEPVPDTRTLKDELWLKHDDMVGLEINEEGQINLLSQFSSYFKDEYESFPRNKPSVSYQYYVNNGAFGPVDGEILYCMIRHFKPRKIFEIGSGNSTYLAAQAVLKNREEGGNECELIAFEPYPNNVLKAGFPGLSKLIPNEIQDVPLSKFNLRIPCGLPQGNLVKYIKNFRCCEAASPWRNTLWSCHRDSQGEGNFLLD